jgi:hypothetical protein
MTGAAPCSLGLVACASCRSTTSASRARPPPTSALPSASRSRPSRSSTWCAASCAPAGPAASCSAAARWAASSSAASANLDCSA